MARRLKSSKRLENYMMQELAASIGDMIRGTHLRYLECCERWSLQPHLTEDGWREFISEVVYRAGAPTIYPQKENSMAGRAVMAPGT